MFSDNIFCLREYATRLRKPFIYGATSHAERTQVLHAFKHKPEASLRGLLAVLSWTRLAMAVNKCLVSKLSWHCVACGNPVNAMHLHLLAFASRPTQAWLPRQHT